MSNSFGGETRGWNTWPVHNFVQKRNNEHSRDSLFEINRTCTYSCLVGLILTHVAVRRLEAGTIQHLRSCAFSNLWNTNNEQTRIYLSVRVNTGDWFSVPLLTTSPILWRTGIIDRSRYLEGSRRWPGRQYKEYERWRRSTISQERSQSVAAAALLPYRPQCNSSITRIWSRSCYL